MSNAVFPCFPDEGVQVSARIEFKELAYAVAILHDIRNGEENTIFIRQFIRGNAFNGGNPYRNTSCMKNLPPQGCVSSGLKASVEKNWQV